MPIEIEDFHRLVTELMGGSGQGVEITPWAESRGINPDALYTLISTVTWNIKEEFFSALKERAEPTGVTDEGQLVMAAEMDDDDLASLLGTVAFQAFGFAWEAAVQMGGAAKDA